MPRGDKSKYTEKQKRQAEKIEKGYRKRGVGEGEAERRAWATVNKMTGGGRKSGSGVGKPTNKAPAKKRWPQGWCGIGRAPEISPRCLGQEGGGNPQATRTLAQSMPLAFCTSRTKRMMAIASSRPIAGCGGMLPNRQ